MYVYNYVHIKSTHVYYTYIYSYILIVRTLVMLLRALCQLSMFSSANKKQRIVSPVAMRTRTVSRVSFDSRLEIASGSNLRARAKGTPEIGKCSPTCPLSAASLLAK